MKIAGSGHIPAGEYNDDISISGSGRIDGNVRCNSLSCSGAASSAGDVHCSEKAKVSGSAHFEKSLFAKDISVSGALRINGDCSAENELKVSGGFKCGGSIKCTSLRASGGIRVSQGIEAEDIRISGSVHCDGLMNAEKIEIIFDRTGGDVGSIGGSDIKIYSEGRKTIKRLPLFSKLAGGSGFKVRESIEGDVIAIENVDTPLVVGRIVAIGAGCQIDLVQYSEEIEINPDAKVNKYEKV